MDKQEILRLLISEPWEELRLRADAERQAAKGGHVFCRGLIEFSSICRRNCAYCGLRAQNAKAHRYRLKAEAILEAATESVAHGADSIVLQSGEGACDAMWLAEVVKEISDTLRVPVTLSVGERNERDYELWKDAGAARYLLRHESADTELYAKLHPGYALKDRLRCLSILKSLGYETGGGFIVGLPGQTMDILAEDIALCVHLKLDMAGIGPFIAQTDTPLAGATSGSIDLCLRALAILRIAMPNANLPATTALATLDPKMGQIRGLMAGANVLMPNFTPREYGSAYSIYDKKKRVDICCAARDIEFAGRSHSLKM